MLHRRAQLPLLPRVASAVGKPLRRTGCGGADPLMSCAQARARNPTSAEMQTSAHPAYGLPHTTVRPRPLELAASVCVRACGRGVAAGRRNSLLQLGLRLHLGLGILVSARRARAARLQLGRVGLRLARGRLQLGDHLDHAPARQAAPSAQRPAALTCCCTGRLVHDAACRARSAAPQFGCVSRRPSAQPKALPGEGAATACAACRRPPHSSTSARHTVTLQLAGLARLCARKICTQRKGGCSAGANCRGGGFYGVRARQDGGERSAVQRGCAPVDLAVREELGDVGLAGRAGLDDLAHAHRAPPGRAERLGLVQALPKPGPYIQPSKYSIVNSVQGLLHAALAAQE